MLLLVLQKQLLHMCRAILQKMCPLCPQELFLNKIVKTIDESSKLKHVVNMLVHVCIKHSSLLLKFYATNW